MTNLIKSKAWKLDHVEVQCYQPQEHNTVMVTTDIEKALECASKYKNWYPTWNVNIKYYLV
jgi:hypothetical protein